MYVKSNSKCFVRTLYSIVVYIILHVVRPSFAENFDTSTLTYLDVQPREFSALCFDHQECSIGTFCVSAGYIDGWLRSGRCRPCSECYCNAVAIDSLCPAKNCVVGETNGVAFLQGSLYSSHEVTSGDICVTVWVFEGQSFRQLSFYVEKELYNRLLKNDAIHPADTGFDEASTQCSEVHAGVKAGVFSLSSPNQIHFIYTDGYDYYQNASLSMSAQYFSSCPDIDLELDRTFVPLFIPLETSWKPSAAAMSAFDFISDPRLSCSNSVGFCLPSSNYAARTKLTMRLRRFPGSRSQGDLVTVFRSSLANNAWKKDLQSQFRYFNSGSLCSMIIEQSNLNYGLMYFRTQIYGCSAQAVSVVTTTRPSTTTQPIAVTSTVSNIDQVLASSTSEMEAVTTLMNVSVSNAPTAPQTTPGPCLDRGDLDLFSGSHSADAIVLNCSAGSIDLINYPLSISRFWRIDIHGPISVSFSQAIGLYPLQDYIAIKDADSTPTFLTGHDSDPSSRAGLYVCLDLSTCAQGGRVFEMLEYNQIFNGPLSIQFVSNPILSKGGAILSYRANIASVRNVDAPAERLKKLTARRSGHSLRRDEPVECKCDEFPVEDCPSLLFQSSGCTSALSFAPWLTYHRPSIFNISQNRSTIVDAIVYLERFIASRGADGLYVTATFNIFNPNIAHPLDVIALFKGDDNDTGSCDEFRTLASCSRRSPLSRKPTLSNQLCWAYTSTLSDIWADHHKPNFDVRLSSGTVKFCNDVALNAGDGTYYIILYSFVLQQIIAEIDYIQPRDCGLFNFPCTPNFGTRLGIQYDYTGPLAVCVPGWFRNSVNLCELCERGTYSNSFNSLSCFGCPLLYYSPPPYLNCTPCPAKPDLSLLDVCSVSSDTDNFTTSHTAAVKTTTRGQVIGTTAPFTKCGDGIVAASDSIGVWEQCDDGPASGYSNLSKVQSISIFEVLNPTRAANDLQLLDRICDYTTCTLAPLYCGDGTITSYRPIYSLSECTRINELTVCYQSAQLKYNNKLVVYNESCDDGNPRSGDGCSSECKIEPLYECQQVNGLSICHRTCPNGIINDNGEQCDDGNLIDGDGCSSSCQIECGFFCDTPNPRATSICSTTCGDGILAGLEQCDTALISQTTLNPFAGGCNRFCQIERGWQCNNPPSSCETNVMQMATCSPICGDGFLVSPEECDDLEWNLDDKACLSTCKLNHGDVCYGPSCLSPNPKSRASQSDLISVLHGSSATLAEGIMISRDAFSTTEGLLDRTVGIWPKKYLPVSSIFPGLFAASPISRTEALKMAQLVSAPFCYEVPSRVWQATTGRITESLKFLANNVSCTYRLMPTPQNQIPDYAIIRLYIKNIILQAGSKIVFTQTSPTINISSRTRECQLSGPFDANNYTGPIYLLAPAEISFFVPSVAASLETIMFFVDFEFTTIFPPNATIAEMLCSFDCKCDFLCSRLCFEKRFKISHSDNFGVQHDTLRSFHRKMQRRESFTEVSYPVAKSDHNQFLVIKSDEAAASNFSSTIFPTSFSQSPTTSFLIEMETISNFVSKIFQGSWQGSCNAELRGGENCSVLVHISNDTIKKHIWGCSLRGYSIGRIIQMDDDFSTGLDTAGQLCSYLYARVIWVTSTLSADKTNTPILSLFSIGEDAQVGSNLQILLSGATQTQMGDPAFFSNGLLPRERNCRLLTLQRSEPPRIGTQESPGAKGEDEKSFLTCNKTVSESISKLQASSRDCFILIRILLLRDFWEPIDPSILVLNSDFTWSPLSDAVCTSNCLQEFISDMQKAIDVCANTWKRLWWNWQVALRHIKLLLSTSSALYWATLLCSSNRIGQPCAVLTGFPDSQCRDVLPQSLYSPRFLANNLTCTPSCMDNLSSYISKLDCCAPTIEKAGKLFTDTLMNPHVVSLEADFGDRANLFNATFPEIPQNLVQLRFNQSSGMKVFANGSSIHVESKYIISAQNLFDSCGMSCAWPIGDEACCNKLQCENGNKSFRGACYCDCFPGFQGRYCDKVGYFVEVVLSFPGHTFLDTFSYCDQLNFERLVGESLSVATDLLDFRIAESSLRRSTGNELQVRLKIASMNCEDSKRTTQKFAAFAQQSLRFQQADVPVPVLQSVWSFCDGAKVPCGAVSVNGKVDATSLSTTCSAAQGESRNNQSSSEGTEATSSIASTSWQSGVAAVGAIAGAAVLLVPLFCFRSQIKVCLIAQGQKRLKRKPKRVRKTSFRDPTADIVFLQNVRNPEVKELVISVPTTEKFELQFMNDYKPPMTRPDTENKYGLVRFDVNSDEQLPKLKAKRKSSTLVHSDIPELQYIEDMEPLGSIQNASSMEMKASVNSVREQSVEEFRTTDKIEGLEQNISNIMHESDTSIWHEGKSSENAADFLNESEALPTRPTWGTF